MKCQSLIFGELKLWQPGTFQSTTFAFLLPFPRFQNRALVVDSGLSQCVTKSLNPPVFMEPTALLHLLLSCGENVDAFAPLYF